MILQSLAGLAQREGLMANPDYEIKDVHWLIRIGADGRFVTLESLLQPPTAPKKGSGRGLAIAVPRPFPRAATTGITPDSAFLFGNASFVCALDTTQEQKYARRKGELERRSKAFRTLVEEAESATADAGVASVQAFLLSGPQFARARTAVLARVKAGELQSNHLIAFALESDDAPVHLRPIVQDYWARSRSSKGARERERQCLVTGAVVPTVDKHPPIKRVPGGTPSGVAIVSFNDSAFESYGFSRNDNAPVSRGAAEAYTTALNRLLDPAWPRPDNPNETLPEQRVVLSADTVAVFWAERASRVPAALVPAVDQGDPSAAAALGIRLAVDDSYADLQEEPEGPAKTEPLRATQSAPWTGIKPADLDDPGAFRLLILSGGQGRATVRAFHSSTVQEIVGAARQWFSDISLAGLRGRSGLRRLLPTLAARGDREKLPPNLAAEVFLAIFSGRALPVSILESAIRRCRSERDTVEVRGKKFHGQKTRPERMALIKAWLNRALRTPALRAQMASQRVTYQEVRPVMNDEERNKGYLLGRMFACIERMQELALGDVGATVTDRYFGGACATPQAVFPRLLRMEVHHYRKAREGRWGGSARWLHGQIDLLSAWIVGEANGIQDGENLESFLRRSAGKPITGFPGFMPLPEQGLFALGYHQQRAEFFKGRARAGDGRPGEQSSPTQERPEEES